MESESASRFCHTYSKCVQYHPLLKKQVPLATMETEKEDTENIELFWTLFNEAISKATGNPAAVFNPVGWCTDMAAANMAGIKKVRRRSICQQD